VALLVALGVLGGGGAVFYTAFRATGKTIFDLLTENRELKKALTNLTEQRRIGYAKVLGQEKRDGELWTEILFVVTDPKDETKRLHECRYEIEGDVVHFDALIVKFSPQLVMDGKEKALYLWRRIYGEHTSPENGYPIDVEGAEPDRYRKIFSGLPVEDRDLFWNEIWGLAHDKDRLASLGVDAIYGEGVYTQLIPGLIYIFNLDPNGNFYPETIPAL